MKELSAIAVVILLVLGLAWIFVEAENSTRSQPVERISEDVYRLPAIGFDEELRKFQDDGKVVKSIASENDAMYGSTSAFIVVFEPAE